MAGTVLMMVETVSGENRPAEHETKIQFIDSATGFAIQPESITAKPEWAGGMERRFGKNHVSKSGRAGLLLEEGRQTITASSAKYKSVSGPLDVQENFPYKLKFLLDPIERPQELRTDTVALLLRDNATLFQGYVADEESSQPLPGVRVCSLPSGVETFTDAHGFYRVHVPLQSPEQRATAPASLIFEKQGYRGKERRYLELWPRGDWTYRIGLERGGGREVVDERSKRRNSSYNDDAAKEAKVTVTADMLAAVSAQNDVILTPQATVASNATVRVPRNIRVQEPNEIWYVTFNFYMKNTLPSEWISSWNTNSLNAGAVAVRGYALDRFNHKASTSTADICGTSDCQNFDPGDTAGSTDRAVDYTDGYVMINSSGNIAGLEYSSENNSLGKPCGDGFTAPTGGCLYDPICLGHTRSGHGRGMCQYGSKRWGAGQNGFPVRDWTWILKHYYPDLTLVKGAVLVIGDDVKARTANDCEVRSCDDGSITNGVNCTLITTKSPGETGVIIGGPTVITNDGAGFTWYKVQWNDIDSTVGWSCENFLDRIFSVPTAPTNLTATALGNQINLTWTDTSNVEAAFKVERGPTSSGPWLQIAVVDANVSNYADRDLLPDNQWFYRVTAYNAAGASGYSSVAIATTPRSAPVLAAIPNKTITDGALLIFTNTVVVSDHVQLITDFEAFQSQTANGVVLFRTPGFSSSTTNFLDGSPTVNIAAVKDTYPTPGHGSGNVLMVTAQFTNVNNPWLRLTTSNTTAYPNPVIDFTKKLRFNIYSDRAIGVAVGCRETSTASGTPIGSNGGTSGAIEWAGVTNVSGTAPMPSHTVAAGTWTSLTLDFPNETIRNFSGGNGILSTTSGLGVLEHLAIVPAEGVGLYNIYLDDFAVLTRRTLTYSLGTGAPSGASIHPSAGIFTWTPTQEQAPSTNLISVIVTDDGLPALSATNMFTVIVNESQTPVVITTQPTDEVVAVGSDVTFSVAASGTSLQYQWLSDGNILADKTNSVLTLKNIQLTNSGSYSVIVSNSGYSVTSANALLTVLEPVTIVSQPKNRTNNIWDNAFFSVTATGANLSYQWQLHGDNIEGATGSALNFTITGTNSAGTYTVVISNPVGTNVSSAAVLSILNGNLEKIAQWNFNSTTPDTNTSTGATAPSLGSGSITQVGGVSQNQFNFGSSSDPASSGTDNSSRRWNGFTQSIANKAGGAKYTVSTIGYKNIVLSGELWISSRSSAYWRAQYSTNGTDWVDRDLIDRRAAFLAGYVGFVYFSDDLSEVAGVANNANFAYRVVGEWESTATGSGANSYVPADPNDTYNNTGLFGWDMFTVLGTALVPPVIVSSPTSLIKNVLETAVFTASATDAETVVWTKDGSPIGSGDTMTEDGLTISTLTLENLQLSDAGTYIATFFNEDFPDGTASDPANLTVSVPPYITSQPVNVATNPGAVVQFAVGATGTGTLAYQWRFNETNNLADGGVVSGATSATLTLAGVAVANRGVYSVLIGSESGFVLSSNAVLTLLGGPQITNQPSNIGTLNQGESATFEVFATGDALTYQWYFGAVPIPGATNTSYTRTNVQPSDAGVNFTVIVANEINSVTSAPRTIANVIADSTRPTVSVLTPKANIGTNRASINVTGVAKDGKGLSSGSGTVTGVTIIHNAGRSGGSTNTATLTDVSTTTLGKFNFTSAPITLSPGTNTLHLYALDLAGNQSTNIPPFLFYYDTIDTVSLLVPAGGQVKMGTNIWNSATVNTLTNLKVGRSYTMDAFVGVGTNYVFTNWVTEPVDVGTEVLLTNWTQKSKLTFVVQSNMTIHANFITNPFTPVAGTYNGLFYEPTNVMSHASAGFVTIKVKDKSTYSGALNLDGDKVSFSGKFTASGSMTRTVIRSKVGKGPLNLSLAINWNTSNDQVTGFVGDGTWTSELIALKAVTNNPSSVGSYTILIPRNSQAGYPVNSPGGIGSGSITNYPNGFAKIGLTVGDVDKSQKVTFKTSLSKDGKWPLYVPLYQSTTTYSNTVLNIDNSIKKELLGSLFGWVTFGDSNTAPVCTNLNWIKTTIPTNNPNYLLKKSTNAFFYTTGFSNQVALLASPYSAPSTNEPAINFSSAQIVVSDGNLSEPITNLTTAILANKIVVSATSTVGVADKMTITFNKKYGTFSGDFLRPGDGLKTDFIGALLQNTTNASGHFLGTNQSGSVIVTGN